MYSFILPLTINLHLSIEKDRHSSISQIFKMVMAIKKASIEAGAWLMNYTCRLPENIGYTL